MVLLSVPWVSDSSIHGRMLPAPGRTKTNARLQVVIYGPVQERITQEILKKHVLFALRRATIPAFADFVLRRRASFSAQAQGPWRLRRKGFVLGTERLRRKHGAPWLLAFGTRTGCLNSRVAAATLGGASHCRRRGAAFPMAWFPGSRGLFSRPAGGRRSRGQPAPVPIPS